MSGVLRAELRRIATTKLWWIVLICIFVLSAGYAALPAAVALRKNGNRTHQQHGKKSNCLFHRTPPIPNGIVT